MSKPRAWSARLLRCSKNGNMTIADLARWFDRPHATVSAWMKNGRSPRGGPGDVEYSHVMMDALEDLIRRRKGFPLPRSSPAERIDHLRKVREAVVP